MTSVENGDKVQIVGMVEMYQGEPEIIPMRAQVMLL
jgi:DNA/RNA endonuclease YhcR with UshA esterase domain